MYDEYPIGSENSTIIAFNSTIYQQNTLVWNDSWLTVAKCWIPLLVIFGGLGNFITVATIFHQMILHRRSYHHGMLPSSTTYGMRSSWNRRCDTSQNAARSSSKSREFSEKSWRNASQCPPKRTVIMKIQADTILLLHLIFCDFLYCVINLPHTFYVYTFSEYHQRTPTLCAFAAFFRYVTAFAEWMTLAFLTVQRCIDLTKPPNARFFRTKSTLVGIATIWSISILLQIGNVVNGRYGYDRVRLKCHIMGSKSSVLLFFMIESVLPCGLMLFGCFSIIFQIMRNKRRLQKLGVSPEVVAERAKKMWKSATLMLGLLLIFLMCVIPLCIFNVLFVLDITNSLEGEIIVYMIYWTEYVINFLVYAARKRKYRRAYKDFFLDIFRGKGWCLRRDHLRSRASRSLRKTNGNFVSTKKQAVVSFHGLKRDDVSSQANMAQVGTPIVHIMIQDTPPDLLIGHKL